VGNYRRATLFSITSALLALAPKCPVCFLAYFGIFGVTAASASAYRSWLPVVTGLWLTLTVAMLFVRMKGWRRYAPVAVASAAAVSIFTARFIAGSPLLLYAGIVTLFAVVMWSSWLRTSSAPTVCPDCRREGSGVIEGESITGLAP
jgi:hypothetical protein